jgi:acyl carrier protein
MTDTVVSERVLATVKRCVAESLAVPEAEIGLKSRLIDDLGADSLDFVDIVFMLDRELDIRVRETELNFLTRLDFSSPEVMREGHITADVVGRLEPWLPEMQSVPDKGRITPRVLFSLVTVEAIALVVERRLAEMGRSGSGSGSGSG